MMRTNLLLAMFIAALTWADVAWAIDPYAGGDPFWILLHEPEVLNELKLTSTQRPQFQKLMDELDLRFFPCRNKSVKEAQSEFGAITAEARDKLETILRPTQNQRLTEIQLWQIGMPALSRDDVKNRMGFTETQSKRIKEILTDTQASVSALEKDARDGKPREPLEKKYKELKTEEQRKLIKLLTPEQRATWKDLIGKPFDVSKLGRPAFKAPELVNTNDWINSRPLSLASLRGKVVVVHFYASGCSNCIHNYPWYLEWHKRFQDKDVVLIGIHTPETESERNPANVRKRAAEAKFEFPVLIDGKSENWNAWGNSMWPSVYIIDQRGYVRQFWPGELKWQGNDGEKFMRDQIEMLLEKPER